MNIKKIKPCPFCNSPAKLHEYYESYDNHREYRYLVECNRCTCTGPGAGYLSPNEAIATWNTRPGEETPRERFKREYRDARMVAMNAPAPLPYDRWLLAMASQCTPEAIQALLGNVRESMETLPIKCRLTLHQQKKNGGNHWKQL